MNAPDPTEGNTLLSTIGRDHQPSDTQSTSVAPGHMPPDSQNVRVGRDYYSSLVLDADVLDDLERTRIAAENRLRTLEREADEQGTGKGLAGSPEAIRSGKLVKLLKATESQAVRNLESTMQMTPLGKFISETPGLGFKSAARFLGTIGDPAWNSAAGRPRRGPAELWALCGLHTVDGKSPRHQKGQQSNWNGKARTRAWVMADSAYKNRECPYRKIYDRERAKWEDRDMPDWHKHKHAVRMVAKSIVRDMYRVANDQKPVYGTSGRR